MSTLAVWAHVTKAILNLFTNAFFALDMASAQNSYVMIEVMSRVFHLKLLSFLKNDLFIQNDWCRHFLNVCFSLFFSESLSFL